MPTQHFVPDFARHFPLIPRTANNWLSFRKSNRGVVISTSRRRWLSARECKCASVSTTIPAKFHPSWSPRHGRRREIFDIPVAGEIQSMLRSAEVSQSRCIGSATPLLLNSRTLGRGDLATADLERPTEKRQQRTLDFGLVAVRRCCQPTDSHLHARAQ